VTSAAGDVQYREPKKTTKVLPTDVARDVSFALQQVVRNGTGRNALDLGRPAAGKTGTATNADGNVSSSWFVGYTPQLSTAVMYVRGDGNDNLNCVEQTGKSCTPGYLVPYFGAEYPTRTWTEAVRGTLDGAPTLQFPPPGNVEAKQDDHGPAPTFTPEPTPVAPAPTQAPPSPTRTTQAPPSPTRTTQAPPSPTPTPTPTPPPAPPTPTAPSPTLIPPSPTGAGGGNGNGNGGGGGNRAAGPSPTGR
jgi:membrane peptidoglycan carboxypeptidase